MWPFSVNAVKAIRTTPCMTTKQWDEHLKKQRDEVKRYVNLEKLPKVVQVRPVPRCVLERGV
jgi:hypothetical protein